MKKWDIHDNLGFIDIHIYCIDTNRTNNTEMENGHYSRLNMFSQYNYLVLF